MIPCPGCRRHVREAETSCPFCLSAMPLRPKPVPPMRGRALRREVLLFATTLAIGCGSTVDEPTPNVDAGAETKTDTATSWDVPEPDTNVPVPDTSMNDDIGGGVPLYGGAPPP